jgi:hypothetical protein
MQQEQNKMFQKTYIKSNSGAWVVRVTDITMIYYVIVAHIIAHNKYRKQKYKTFSKTNKLS